MSKVIFFIIICKLSNASPVNFGIVIHGGSGTKQYQTMTPELKKSYYLGLKNALNKGYKILNNGGDSTNAVAAAISELENNPLFNEGKGAVYSEDGRHVLEASIMDGYTSQAGAATGLKHIKNPIQLAMLILQKSPSILLMGAYAEAFGLQHGVLLVPNQYFDTSARHISFMDWRQKQKTHRRLMIDDEQRYGTVGAVALDKKGHFAAGTSTGGLTGKNPGRIGDSAIIGAGAYASKVCAVATTGRGEDFIRFNVAGNLCARVEFNDLSISKAAALTFNEFSKNGGQGGLVGIGINAEIFMLFNTKGMYRGAKTSTGMSQVAIYSDK